MKPALITPWYYKIRGNSITVRRIESGLKSEGLSVKVFSQERYKGTSHLGKALGKWGPQILHAFHAYRTGGIVVDIAARLSVPAVINITGTDGNHDLFDPERRGTVIKALKMANGIVVFHEFMRDRISKEIPEVAEKVWVIRQAVKCEERPYNFRERLGFNERDFVFFLPAGIRKVKNLTFCLKPLTHLKKRYPFIKVVFAGPIIEEKEGERLLKSIKGLDWAYYIGEVSHERVCSILRSVDVLVNSSISEGGMSNSILEAMSRGVAVLAADIEGNRSILVDGVDGLLFCSEGEFIEKAEAIINDEGYRRKLGEKAREKIEREFSLKKEIADYMRLYQEILTTRAISAKGGR